MSDSEPEIEEGQYETEEEKEDIEREKKRQTNLPRKEKIIYLSIWIKMQREISDKVFLGDSVPPLNDMVDHLPLTEQRQIIMTQMKK